MAIEDKIRALSLKTVANGASEAEAEAARRMIERLRAPHLSKKKEKQEIYANGLYNTLPVSDVDWDLVAEQYLDHIQHSDYVAETHNAWTRYNRTRMKIGTKYPLSESEYRHICHESFTRLYERKQIS